MIGNCKNLNLPPRKWLSLSLACLILTVPIAFSWYLIAADSRVNPATATPGKFQFARLRYPGGIPDYIKNWYTDYPSMDRHLTTLIGRMTGIDVAQPFVVEPSSAAIFDFPMIYSVEPEQMDLRPRDVENLRQYLARGGFWFADDFHGDEEFNQFLEQLRRVIPNAHLVELTTEHPLFHCFYDIEEIIQVTNDSIAKCPECDQWENGPSGREPKVYAVFDDRGRMNVLLAWNTDLGDGLEWADDPYYPGFYSAYAFRFMTNVVVYAMSH